MRPFLKVFCPPRQIVVKISSPPKFDQSTLHTPFLIKIPPDPNWWFPLVMFLAPSKWKVVLLNFNVKAIPHINTLLCHWWKGCARTHTDNLWVKQLHYGVSHTNLLALTAQETDSGHISPHGYQSVTWWNLETCSLLNCT